MDHLYLFATLAGTCIAVEAAEVDAVARLTDISPVPGLPAHIAGLSAMRSRVLTIVDVAVLIRGTGRAQDGAGLAIIADIGGHSYGLMVDAVSDICEVGEGVLPLRGQLDPIWSPYARGVVEKDGHPWLLVSLASFIDGSLTAQAA